MKVYQLIPATLVIIGLSVTSADALSLKQIKRGFKSCTGNCSKDKIKCTGKPSETGSVEWCQKNCVYKGKKDLHITMAGISSCGAEVTVPAIGATPPSNDDAILVKLQKRQKLTDAEGRRVRELMNKAFEFSGAKLSPTERQIIAAAPTEYIGTPFDPTKAMGGQ